MWVVRILSAGMLMSVSACTGINHNLGAERWFNPSLPIHLQHTLFEQEQQFCAQAAHNWVPIPDIKFLYGGVRTLNNTTNASVDGMSMSSTYGNVSASWATAATGSSTSTWMKVGAAVERGYRESHALKGCLFSLGWNTTSDTWDGTPGFLNESLTVNHHVMRFVGKGFTHPILGDEVIAMINRDGSYERDKLTVLETAEIPVYGSKVPLRCTYTLTRSLVGTKGEVGCNNDLPVPIRIERDSPVARWLSVYF